MHREFGLADGTRVGCGFITWSLARKPELLDEALERQPATIMLSFGDLQPFIDGWHGNESELLASLGDAVSSYEAAVAADDFTVAAMFVGEVIGRIVDVRPAADPRRRNGS